MLNKRPIILIAAIIIFVGFLAAGIIYLLVSQSSTTNTTAFQQGQAGQIVVDLVQLNNSGESGTAVFEEKGDYVVVTLNVTGGKAGITQPAHIHVDTCPGLGSVKYPLKNVVDGTSVTTLNLTLDQLKQELPLAINVHESTDNFKSYVACGEVSL